MYCITLSQYDAERTASMCQVTYSCSIPCEAWASMRPVVRPIPIHLDQHSCFAWVPAIHALHLLPYTYVLHMRTVVLLPYRTALASTLLPASGQRMATVVLHLVSARRGSVGRLCEPPWVSQKSRLCGSRRNRAVSEGEPEANMFVWHTIGQRNRWASEQAISEWANGERTDVREPKKLRFGTNPKANEQRWIGRVESFLGKIFAGKQWKNQ